jgi:hypothetical protein
LLKALSINKRTVGASKVGHYCESSGGFDSGVFSAGGAVEAPADDGGQAGD